MVRRLRIYAMFAVTCMLASISVYAQPKAISTIWSLNGIGIGYEHNIDGNSFIQIEMKTETAELFINSRYEAGATLAFTWNMIFGSMLSKHGNTVNFYAGPGAVIGWAGDSKTPSGGLFGVKGKIGVECVYARRISVSASLSPSLAMHLSVNEDNEFNMKTFRNGLTYGLLPEIGIKYCF